jgi:CysZ protein
LFEHKLAWFLWTPLVITILVFWGGFSLTSWATKIIADTIDVWINGATWMPEWAAVIQDLVYWLIWLVMRVVLYFAFAFIGGSIILLLMSPILTYLSERVASALNAEVPAFSITQFMRDLTRAAGLALKNGALQIMLSLVCFFIGFLPVIGVLSPFLLIGINAYFYGVNFMDYSLERRKYTIQESGTFVWKHKTTTMSLGTPFALWMIIPLIGPITSGFVAIFATVAATLEIQRMGSLSLEQDED